MNDIRRRVMMGSKAASLYPFVSDYPEFNEFGTFLLTMVSYTGTGQTNTFIASGSTNYSYCGGAAKATTWYRLTITPDTIKLVHASAPTKWIEKAFAGFPVKVKRCGGTVNSEPLITFEVTKEE